MFFTHASMCGRRIDRSWPGLLVGAQWGLVVDSGDGVFLAHGVTLDGVGSLDSARRGCASEQSVPSLGHAQVVRERCARFVNLADDLLVFQIRVWGGEEGSHVRMSFIKCQDSRAGVRLSLI
jgi:hypothetical protein